MTAPTSVESAPLIAPPAPALRVLFVLPGLHRVARGAEVAFQEIARALARRPGCKVTLIGSGDEHQGEPYRFLHAGSISRQHFEWWPGVPYLRDHYVCEELSFVPGLMRAYRPQDYDVTVTCSYPYTNWALRYRTQSGRRPRHVFVTQNGDWMVGAKNWEYRHFGCDGLVCTNPVFHERHRDRWPSVLIPNGVDPKLFHPGPGDRARFGLPVNAPVVLMVSALIGSKRVCQGIQAVAQVPGAFLIVAGDGELREQVQRLGERRLSGRFRLVQLPRAEMPSLYRSADVFLHMSQDESSANAYIEALATGLPVVTHDWEVTRWTFEDAAHLVDSSDLQQVAGAIQRAIATASQQALQARLRMIEDRYAWNRLAGEYHAFFQKIVVPPQQGAA